jgi:MFS superfamily sulfate permease-like transporter
VLTLASASGTWTVGIVIGSIVIAVAAAIVITIVWLAMRIAKQARIADQAVELVRQQTAELGGVAQINDSGVRILHSARALRKVAVGK